MPDQYVCPECGAASPIPGVCDEDKVNFVLLDEDAVVPVADEAGEEAGKYKPKDLETPLEEVDEDDLTINLKGKGEKEEG
ncbi:MAG: hypothetical protein Athens101428_259 [Candidatus Berkelbacteria bacterium Athens1014_28]|uniref:Uncharacterized protein n=1 Tax=Candidatus Berkelbacteria bacterium Athens1014_28 TaxID=2017145 RepID=A0A554LNV4_9BACT|nr:MAG: hypothetical protein Athens101428_259 [Candidatus Berkelbacteria bacterium Athens1014_28]